MEEQTIINIEPRQILGHGHFFQRTMLEASRFVDYCKKRGIDISKKRLEKFEELEIFFPMLRIEHPEIQIKRRTIKDENGLEETYEFGRLQEGETWDAELSKYYSACNYGNKEFVDSWIEENLIYFPTKETFQPWSNYYDEEGFNKIESFYSIFQALSLKILVQSFTLKSRIEELAFKNEEYTLAFHRNTVHHFQEMVKIFADGDSAWDKYAKVCQVISSRYLPYAESDGITISLPAERFTGFNFFEYRRNWNAKEILNEIGLSVDDVAGIWEQVAYRTEWINPISAWDELVNIINKEKRERLKDKALLAETWKIMAKMLNLFYEDLTGRKLYMQGHSPEHIEVFRGKGITIDSLQYLEFVANDFGVNPRPKLILMVEGKGEFNEIPKLAKWAFGRSLGKYRIQIINLNTIGEFTSKKIERFIDHFHDLQTIVYFILDNENRAKQRKESLVRTSSLYINGFSITKDEFFTIWDKNIEFDNFTDLEIANAMTNFCENRYEFSQAEIEKCRGDFGTKKDPISCLYKAKLSYGLDKPKFLGFLFEQIKIDYEIELNGVRRKRLILDALNSITRLAFRNYQPTRLDTWTQNQNSGWLRNRLS